MTGHYAAPLAGCGRRLPPYSASVRVFDANWMRIEAAEVRELLVSGRPE
jgi:hypothetical protein